MSFSRHARPRLAIRLARLTAGACLVATFVVAVGPARAAAGQGPDDAAAIARAFVDALASGNAERFEAMAREWFTPALLARRTPDERALMVARIKADFGTLTLAGVRNLNDQELSVDVNGSSGLAGRITLRLDGAPRRIAAMAINVGDRNEGPRPPSVDAGMTPAELGKALDAYLAPRVATDEFAGTVAIARDGTTIFEKSYGLADREKKAPVDPATRFNLASIGKAFTKVAIGQLVAQGRLALTDTIGKLLSDHPNEQAKVATVEQLLNHQAGIVDVFGPAFDAAPKTDFASNADYYRFVASQPLLFPPGTIRRYCNGCYIVLGQIVERVSGQRFEDYVARHVFAPAGMKEAGYFRSDRAPANTAVGYTHWPDRQPGAPLVDSRDRHGVAGSGAGGCYGTARDLLAFDNALRDGRLLDAAMTAWYYSREPGITGPAGGAGTRAAEGGRAGGGIAMAGGAPGVNTLLETDGHWAVAVVTNLDEPAASVGTAIMRQLAR